MKRLSFVPYTKFIQLTTYLPFTRDQDEAALHIKNTYKVINSVNRVLYSSSIYHLYSSNILGVLVFLLRILIPFRTQRRLCNIPRFHRIVSSIFIIRYMLGDKRRLGKTHIKDFIERNVFK